MELVQTAVPLAETKITSSNWLWVLELCITSQSITCQIRGAPEGQIQRPNDICKDSHSFHLSILSAWSLSYFLSFLKMTVAILHIIPHIIEEYNTSTVHTIMSGDRREAISSHFSPKPPIQVIQTFHWFHSLTHFKRESWDLWKWLTPRIMILGSKDRVMKFWDTSGWVHS